MAAGIADTLNEGRGTYPGDTPGSPARRPRAPPGAQRRPGHLPRRHPRPSPNAGDGLQPPRSTKAGALTPATLLILQKGEVRAKQALLFSKKDSKKACLIAIAQKEKLIFRKWVQKEGKPALTKPFRQGESGSPGVRRWVKASKARQARGVVFVQIAFGRPSNDRGSDIRLPNHGECRWRPGFH